MSSLLFRFLPLDRRRFLNCTYIVFLSFGFSLALLATSSHARPLRPLLPSISFCRGPHLTSIFARWLCIGIRSHETDGVRNIARGMPVRSSIPSLYPSLSFFLRLLSFPFLPLPLPSRFSSSLHSVNTDAYLLVSSFKGTYEGKFMRGPPRGYCKVVVK